MHVPPRAITTTDTYVLLKVNRVGDTVAHRSPLNTPLTLHALVFCRIHNVNYGRTLNNHSANPKRL